jgi:CheY-like chemotaxis protein
MKLNHDSFVFSADQPDSQPGLREPVKEKPEETSEGTQSRRPAAPILVVEDNPINQKILATLLRKRGYEVDVANDGAQAVQLAAEKSYGLIFMDLQMPVLDGLEAARLIRSFEGCPQPPIIAVTAYTLNGEPQRCLEAGMNGYLPKPVDTHALLDTVERCLRTA